MINPGHFRRRVVGPTLRSMGLRSAVAADLLVGTALAESGLAALEQYGAGPALGVYQMEPATYHDIWRHYLRYRPRRAAQARRWASTFTLPVTPRPAPEEMTWNLRFATAMARLHYLRVPEPLPRPGVSGDRYAMKLARYHKEHYNTHLGQARVEDSVEHFRRALDLPR